MKVKTLQEQHKEILNEFSACKTQEQVYNKIMELGRKQVKLSAEQLVECNLVSGCQSQLYLVSEISEGRIFFKAFADALISSGLAQLLIWYYSGQTLETVLKEPPSFLDELNIPGSLTPSRANGLYSVHLRMKQEALKGFVSH